MGKAEEGTLAILGSQPPTNPSSSCCKKSTCRWIVSVVLGAHLLALAVLSLYFHRSIGSNSATTSSDPSRTQIQASFRLRRPLSLVNESLPQLQLDLQDEIGLPNTQVDIISILPLSTANWTEVRFTVSPDPSNDSIVPVDLSLLKETFVELFMERSLNLSLTDDLFGKVSHFEVVQFPGGITVVPPQPGFPLLKVIVLFNFTLHNSLSNLANNFAEFRQQLANGIFLKPDENLYVQLTNLEGSTLNPPLIVQTSILPVMGLTLPLPRLEQLAEEIIAFPKENLGLNHTLFGKVKGVELSSYLRFGLEPAPAPSASLSSSPSIAPAYPPCPRKGPAGRCFRQHLQHPPAAAPNLAPYHRPRAPASKGITVAPNNDHCHPHHKSEDLAPSPLYPQMPPTASKSLPHSPSSVSVSPVYFPTQSEPSKAPSPSFEATTKPYPGPSEGSSPAHHSPTVKRPRKSSTWFKGPSEVPPAFTPGFAPAPSQVSGRIASVPAVSPTSPAMMLGFPSLAMLAWLVLLVGSI